MSSSPTVPTSTTGSSTCSPSPADPAPGAEDPSPSAPGQRPDPARSSDPGQPAAAARRVALLACGALAQSCARLAAQHGWAVDVHPLPPLLHNRPERIADEVDRLAAELQPHYAAVVVGYADCGTYGALDAVVHRRGLRRLDGLHCYDLYAGADRIAALFDEEPGTYLLTDFLVRSFARTVLGELGLDRHPELRADYFGHYARVVWLSQRPDPELRARAEEAAACLGLPLEVVHTGQTGLARALARMLAEVGVGAGDGPGQLSPR